MRFLRTIAALALLAVATGAAARQVSDYTKALHAKHGKLVHFTSTQAAAATLEFNIACPNSDGRFVPLANVIFTMAGMIDATNRGGIVVENRGKALRVYRTYQPRANGGQYPDALLLELSEWQELRLHGIRKEAVLMFCTDYYGQPWELPAASR